MAGFVVEVSRDREPGAWRLCWCGPRTHRKGPGDPRLIEVFLSPIGLWRQHGDALPPQRRLAGELAPLLLPGSIGVQSEYEITYVARPIPAPALHTENGHRALHTRCEQRQRIERPLADPQRTRASRQRGGVEVTLGARQMVMALGLRDLLRRSHRTAVEVHQAPIRGGMGKDHTPAAPVAGRVWPGTWCRIAHAQLLRQGQRNAPLLQVGVAAAPRQGGLKRGELLGKVRPYWD
jgi:hypothetical protein